MIYLDRNIYYITWLNWINKIIIEENSSKWVILRLIYLEFVETTISFCLFFWEEGFFLESLPLSSGTCRTPQGRYCKTVFFYTAAIFCGVEAVIDISLHNIVNICLRIAHKFLTFSTFSPDSKYTIAGYSSVKGNFTSVIRFYLATTKFFV